MRLRRGVVCFAVLLSAGAPAAAQENNSIAVGVSVTGNDAIETGAHAGIAVGFKWRIGHRDTGWGWHYGLNWYSNDLERRVGGQPVAFGELKVRPVLVGYGYTYSLTERLNATASIVAGVAHTSLDLTPEAVDAYHAMAAQSVRAHSGFAPVIRPEVGVWYDLNRRLGLSVDVSYLLARPTITVTTSAGRESSRFRADILSLSVGVVYRIF